MLPGEYKTHLVGSLIGKWPCWQPLCVEGREEVASAESAANPIWSPDGDRLYFLGLRGAPRSFVVADVDLQTDDFVLGAPLYQIVVTRNWFEEIRERFAELAAR